MASFCGSISGMILIVILLGIICGSFVNALVWRLRQQLTDDGEPRKLSAKRRQELSIVHGRSMCPHCKHRLAWKDLVPVLSWLMLRGRCRYCSRSIGLQYPLVELLAGLLFGLSYAFWPLDLTSWVYVQFATWLVALVALVALAIYDARWMILPDRLLVPVIIVVASSTLLQLMLGRPIGDLVAILASVGICSGIFYLVYLLGAVLHKPLIGFGDVKLGVLLGLLIGTPLGGLLMLFLASLLGCLWSLVLVVRSHLSRKQYMGLRVPFGPFLITATILVVLWGRAAIDWYLTQLSGVI